MLTTSLAAIEQNIRAINKKGEPTFDAVFQLQPLDKVHLYSKHILYDVTGQGDITYVRLFSIVAVFILLVACINFMSLATARSARRAKEVGVRKVDKNSRGESHKVSSNGVRKRFVHNRASRQGRIARSSTLATARPALFN
ncbi:MAG TPA: hypothetical protein VHC96_23585 [Puia sp.]|nr:hypothetical protein [Puia sp.]